MPSMNDIASSLTDSATSQATRAVGFHVDKAVNVVVDGVLDLILGESTDDRRREMNEHHDRLLEIVSKTPITPPRAQSVMSPRQRIEVDTRESNEHIRNALEELNKARNLTKCGACKASLDNTINAVGEATSEILDSSEKVLAMQKLKDVGEIAPEQTWDDLTKDQKVMVNQLVDQYHPLRPELLTENEEEEGERQNGRKKQVRKPPAKKRKTTGRGKK
jgi:hypothetical protein